MILGIMQPYFFPYLGYFDLINYADKWVVFDTAQYMRHGWVNRNRILHPARGWQYIGVPVKHHAREAPISQIEIAAAAKWRRRIPGQFAHYKSSAPNFDLVDGLLRDVFSFRWESLSRFNIFALRRCCHVLGIEFDYKVFSELSLNLGPIEGPGDWALRICEALGAEEYINPPGGADLFDSAKFAAAGIKLTIQSYAPLVYDCGAFEFIPDLSILDVLLWNTPAHIMAHLNGPGLEIIRTVEPGSLTTGDIVRVPNCSSEGCLIF